MLYKKKSTTKIFKDFAKLADILYIGDIEDHTQHAMRGVTFTAGVKDSQFVHGNIKGHEVSAILRQVPIKLHSKRAYRAWTVLKVSLNQTQLPHVYIDSRHTDENMRKFFLAKLPRLRNAGSLISRINPTFYSLFSVFTSPLDALHLQTYLNDNVMQTIVKHFAAFDFELIDGDVYVCLDSAPSRRQLNSMLNAGLWLAQHSEYAAANLSQSLVASTA